MYSSTTGPRRVRRAKVEVMSQEAQDTNPYSRLMALKSMGVVKNYERVRDFSVAVVGIGGVGVSVVEMLTRCGIGKVIIYDYDTIELANMNKMFYRPEQSGWNKTMACRHYCSELNPDTAFEVHNMKCAARARAPSRGVGWMSTPPLADRARSSRGLAALLVCLPPLTSPPGCSPRPVGRLQHLRRGEPREVQGHAAERLDRPQGGRVHDRRVRRQYGGASAHGADERGAAGAFYGCRRVGRRDGRQRAAHHPGAHWRPRGSADQIAHGEAAGHMPCVAAHDRLDH
jgi:hypothetical protein